MLDLLSVPSIERAMLAGGIIGLVCSMMGVFVVLRGLAFISAGISHSAFAGVAFGLLFGVSPFASALVFCALVSVLIGKVSDLGRIKEDTSIGVFLAASMALGVIIMSFVKDARVDVVGYLFGSILTLSSDDVILTVIIGGLVLGIIFLIAKELMLSSFDPDQAVIAGIPAQKLTYLLLILLSAVTVVSIKVVGIILGTALITAPAATALQFSRDFDRAIILAGIIGVAVTEIGILLSLYLDTAPGATITIVATIVFFASLIRRKRFA
jgi:ABC-type Mn2+/Zn2+ transport system permease subunit